MTAATVREEQIPAEFLYWEHVNSRGVQRARRAWRTLWGFDPQPSDELVRRFAHSFYEADPVAEAFVDEVYLERGAQRGRELLDCALAHGIEAVPNAPESMQTLFAEFETEPEWLDRDQAELGARVFRRYGTSVFSFATTSTLEMYSESSVAKPLSLAGGYAGDTAHKRQLATARFWIDISDPGGLTPGAHGRATAMRVRIMHVFLRRRLLKHREWDSDAWGMPISIGDATMTLLGGSTIPGLALRSAGHQTTIREIEALLHLWRYVGRLLGVQPDYYPETFQDDRVQIGYTRFWSLPATYSRHEMPRAWPWALHPVLQFPVVFTLETYRRMIPPLDDAADHVERWRRDRWYATETGGADAAFTPVEEFRR